MRIKKYIDLTDTDMDSIVNTFKILIDTANDIEFKKYIDLYYKEDQLKRKYVYQDVKNFCTQVIGFIDLKRSRLRVKTNLKLHKDFTFSSIFPKDYIIPKNLNYWINILLDYNFSKYDIHDDVDNMEDTYKEMYEDYILEQSKIRFDDSN